MNSCFLSLSASSANSRATSLPLQSTVKMMFKTTAVALLLGAATATPIFGRAETSQTKSAPQTTATNSVYDWSEGWAKDYPIHQSCNATLRRQLVNALDETVQLAQHAKDHLLRWGNESEFKQKYFGNGSTATPIGWYDRVINANKAGMLFRCDDPDKNCATQDKWAGHWRGDNATTETVICPLSFEIRRSLDSVCGLGYTVAQSKLNTFWATDLLHRVLHVPTISEGIVDHFAEDYAEALELAKTDPSKSVIDSDALQYFAIDVYAYDIAAPGEGCTGEAEEKETPTKADSAKPSATKEAPKECHTHSDGVVHCS